MKKITYKSLVIILEKQGRDYTWKVTKLDGSPIEDAESAQEFYSEELAMEDAEAFIDDWYR